MTGIFHCFVGTLDEARRAVDLGFKLGIGGVSTFKNGGLDKVLPHVGLEHLVLETDAPYLAPVPHRGKRNEPAYIRLIAQRLADLKQISLDDVARAYHCQCAVFTPTLIRYSVARVARSAVFKAYSSATTNKNVL